MAHGRGGALLLNARAAQVPVNVLLRRSFISAARDASIPREQLKIEMNGFISSSRGVLELPSSRSGRG